MDCVCIPPSSALVIVDGVITLCKREIHNTARIKSKAQKVLVISKKHVGSYVGDLALHIILTCIYFALL